MAEENGLTIDENAFKLEMEKSKEISKNRKSANNGISISLDVHALSELERNLKVKQTIDIYKYGTVFFFVLSAQMCFFPFFTFLLW